LEVVVESYQAGHLIDLLSVSTTISPASQPAATAGQPAISQQPALPSLKFLLTHRTTNITNAGGSAV